MEGNTQPNLKLGPDRIFNKPVKIFKKHNGEIKREVHERDALNMFEIVESPPSQHHRSMGRSNS